MEFRMKRTKNKNNDSYLIPFTKHKHVKTEKQKKTNRGKIRILQNGMTLKKVRS